MSKNQEKLILVTVNRGSTGVTIVTDKNEFSLNQRARQVACVSTQNTGRGKQTSRNQRCAQGFLRRRTRWPRVFGCFCSDSLTHRLTFGGAACSLPKEARWGFVPAQGIQAHIHMLRRTYMHENGQTFVHSSMHETHVYTFTHIA